MAGHLYMAFMIPLTWLVFAVTDIRQIILYFQRLFPVFARQQQFFYFSGDYVKYARLYAVSLVAGLLFMTDIPIRIYARFKYSMITAAALLGIFWLCVYIVCVWEWMIRFCISDFRQGCENEKILVQYFIDMQYCCHDNSKSAAKQTQRPARCPGI